MLHGTLTKTTPTEERLLMAAVRRRERRVLEQGCSCLGDTTVTLIHHTLAVVQVFYTSLTPHSIFSFPPFSCNNNLNVCDFQFGASLIIPPICTVIYSNAYHG